ncbi:MAG: asparagine synthase (glutamine-hydrolyzing) [bacterium]|nr:asparagine synthase (glutamine-hydrolyzing) [bacterium]
MCGIAGFIGKGDEKTLRDMIGTIRHRGPDDLGIYYENDVGFSHARLSILDLSSRGHQPMWNDKKDIVIIFNGEIYNFKELKTEFVLDKKYQFQSETDTEAILHLYEKFGEECFQKLDGMFAIAIYDLKKNRLLLARDRIGEKPLYWGMFEKTFVFGSEMKAVLAHKLVKRELNLSALAQYLVREYVPTPNSIFKNIFKLEPAHYLIYEAGKVLKKSFWNIETKISNIPFEEALDQLDQILEKSVKERLVADVPVGIFLSGGIDSSTIAYYAQKASGGKAKTFSIGFDEKSYDESSYAKKVADFLGTDHYHHKVSAKNSLDMLEEVASISGEPQADPSIIPTALLSRFTKGKVTVALGGDGGDELLAGYPTFQADKMVSFYNHLPRFMRENLIEPIVEKLPASDRDFSLSFKLQKFIEGVAFNPSERHGRWLQAFSREEMMGLLTKDIYKNLDGVSYYHQSKDQSSQGILNNYLHSYLMDDVLVKVDRASMRYALEVRAPFLGLKVVEFLTALPYKYKLHGFTTKYVLKELMKDKLPKNIVYRKKKGFGIPVSEWLKKDLKPLLLESLGKDKLEKQGIFNPDYVQRIIEEHLFGAKNNRKKLWTLLVFQLWAKKYLQ